MRDRLRNASTQVFIARPPRASRRELAAGLRIIAALPRLLALWLASPRGAAPAALDRSERFSANALRCLAARAPDAARERLFDVLLVALHGGFGIVAPTIALPRFSASTYASVDMNLVAGLTGCGPAHVGACSAATRMLAGLAGKSASAIRESVGERVRAGGRIPGFGHPLLDRDPRPAALERHVERLGCGGEAFDAYRSVCGIVRDERGLHPNIDAIAASILLDLGVAPAFATPVFLFARMPTMLAHAMQKKAHPPFGQTRAVARHRLATLPKAWI
ncbi:citrate/2-methylcitrate synthase [Burkholderia thailandensis]|uniref:citrate/2-methylcitrate synthase n=1 Tax=Burkholderia thailandensis TaxID=57975 RepID=UPI0027E537F1|nr:citrate/2-methylcitrate synthase [Burkholderia thailandensis]